MKLQLSLLLLSILISLTTGQEGGHDQPNDGGNDHEKNGGSGGNSSGNGSDGKAEDGYSQGFNRGIKPYSYGYNTGVKPYSYNFYQPLGGKKQETRNEGEEDNGKDKIILIKNQTQLVNRKKMSQSKDNEMKNSLTSPDERFTDLIRSENQKRNQVLKPGAVYDDGQDNEENQDSNQDANDQNQDSNQTDFNKGDNEMNEDNESNSNDDPSLPSPLTTSSPFQPHSQIPGMYYTPIKFPEFPNHSQYTPN